MEIFWSIVIDSVIAILAVTMTFFIVHRNCRSRCKQLAEQLNQCETIFENTSAQAHGPVFDPEGEIFKTLTDLSWPPFGNFAKQLFEDLTEAHRTFLNRLYDRWQHQYWNDISEANSGSRDALNTVLTLRNWLTCMTKFGYELPPLVSKWNELVAKGLSHPNIQAFDNPPLEGLRWLAAEAIRTRDITLAKMVLARCDESRCSSAHNVPEPLIAELILLIDARNADLGLYPDTSPAPS